MALGVWDHAIPGYGAAIYLELGKLNTTGEYAVAVSYKNQSVTEPYSEPKLLTLPGR